MNSGYNPEGHPASKTLLKIPFSYYGCRSVRIFVMFAGKCDDVLRLVMRYLNVEVPTYTRFVADCCLLHSVFSL